MRAFRYKIVKNYSMQSIQKIMLKQIQAAGRGWAFSRIDFSELGRDGAIRLALVRLEEEDVIRRVLRGVYDYPKISTLLEEPMGPDLDQVAQALARRSGWRIQPSENTALNLLGLSTQVPARAVYLSDGPSKTYEVGNRRVMFKKRALKESGFALRESELVVQALKALGQERIDSGVRARLVKALPASIWKKMVKDARTAPAWVHDIICDLAEKVAT